jgi:acetoacetate decarboxylase
VTPPKGYIDRAAEVAFTSPSGFSNAKLYGFAVKADKALVHEMLARYISRPSLDLGLRIDVHGTTLDRVLFVFVDGERHQQKRGLNEFEGRHREQLFAILVLGYRLHPDPAPILFAPYVYASSTPGWRAEREIYGYPQQYGKVEIKPDRAEIPAELCARARIIERFAPDAMSEEKTFVRIRKDSSASGGGSLNALPKREIIEWIARTFKGKEVEPLGHRAVNIVPRPKLGCTAADESFLERCSPSFRQPTVSEETRRVNLNEAVRSGDLRRMLFLKQFRDIVYSDRACYQAIVEASFEIDPDIKGFPLEGYVLELKDADSVPIRRELGIPTGDIVPVEFGFRLDVKNLSFGNSAKVISNPHWNPAEEVSIEGQESRLPRYVDRGGEAVWHQPSLLSGARIYGFGVEVPRERQNGLLEKCVNEVAKASNSTYGSQPFKLEACADVVMLLFVRYQKVTSGTDDDRRLGGTAYHEFLVMQLALSPDEEYPELNWFIPFIYLDTDAPRLGGREIFGYPKQLGTIDHFKPYQFDKSYKGDKRFLEPAHWLNLKAMVIRNACDENAEDSVVISVEGPAEPPAIKQRYIQSHDMLLDLFRLAHGPQDPVGIQNALVFNHVGNVFLKQFRDCADPNQACYKAVCKTDGIPGKFRGGGCLDASDYRISVHDHASERLLRYLKGEDAKDLQAPIEAKFAFWLDLDFELTNGRVIANPLEAAYAPDVSVGRTQRDARRPRLRVVRRALQTEPETLSEEQIDTLNQLRTEREKLQPQSQAPLDDQTDGLERLRTGPEVMSVGIPEGT